MKCAVCQDPLFSNVPSDIAEAADLHLASIRCGHVFHMHCINSCRDNTHFVLCPVCRRRHSGAAVRLFLDHSPAECANSAGSTSDRSQIVHDIERLKTVLHSAVELIGDIISELLSRTDDLELVSAIEGLDISEFCLEIPDMDLDLSQLPLDWS
ncbi:hypothetical protein DL89DRAFT_44976 [Linderina pennispora]|uniref:RING-type domain-containing protein n=1 Tax=Linderina pennispora TaxID=61395 RepID=A0A1Y1W2G9_9FUNG|nr:uncharacterized protein DL89DRAFT_44976 [Linderina pennispora]ORX67466.1 hypothetical protein DL89DRAFT_44976 [Linderina pennispora]